MVAGETGTGKELTARALHEHSERAAAPLVTVHCAALPKTLLEAIECLSGSAFYRAQLGDPFVDYVTHPNRLELRLLILLAHGAWGLE